MNTKQTNTQISYSDALRIFGKESKLLKQKEMFENTIKTLESRSKQTDGILLLSRYNSILALSYKGNITHIVDTKRERNLVMLHEIDENLEVPSYESKTAQQWEKEPLVLGEPFRDEPYEKVILSEAELLQLVIKDKKMTLQYIENSIEVLRQAKQREEA